MLIWITVYFVKQIYVFFKSYFLSLWVGATYLDICAEMATVQGIRTYTSESENIKVNFFFENKELDLILTICLSLKIEDKK